LYSEYLFLALIQKIQAEKWYQETMGPTGIAHPPVYNTIQLFPKQIPQQSADYKDLNIEANAKRTPPQSLLLTGSITN
jgi:hypothetical protein